VSKRKAASLPRGVIKAQGEALLSSLRLLSESARLVAKGSIPDPDRVAHERVILAGIQEPRSQMKAVHALLRPADFKIPLHRSAFQAARTVFQQKEPVEPSRIAAHMRGPGSLAYLSELAPNVVSGDEMVSSARRLKQRTAADDINHLPTPARMAIRGSVERLALHTDAVSKQVEQILTSGTATNEQALATVSGVQAAYEEAQGVEAMTSDLASAEPGSDQNTGLARVRAWVVDVAKPAIERVAKQLWAILSALLTPKSWTIGGNLGTGVLGLVGENVSVTFGS
jgi:hypothetical protein